MLKLSQNIINDLNKRNAWKIKIFFYSSWCSWTKVDLIEDFEINDDLILIDEILPFQEWQKIDIFVEKKDFDKFENSVITRIEVKKEEKNEHLKWKKFKYIFTNDKIKDRCGCWTSFSFEKKKPKLNLEKLKNFKSKF